MLDVKDLKVSYGPIPGIRGIDLHIGSGEIVALIGANGAGKSTTIKALAGLLPFSGNVMFNGQNLRPGRAESNLRQGLALVPEGRGILARMTVEENLLMGTYVRRDRAAALADLDRFYTRFPILAQRRHGMAGLLSGGEQQMLAVARALLSRPKLLLLDEPSLGLAPKMTSHIFSIIDGLRQEGLTVLLAEQKSRQTLKIADRAYVLELGRVVMSGTAQELINDPQIAETFLGGNVS